MLTFKSISCGFKVIINRGHPRIRDSFLCTNSLSLHPVCVDCKPLFPSAFVSVYPVTYWHTARPYVWRRQRIQCCQSCGCTSTCTGKDFNDSSG